MHRVVVNITAEETKDFGDVLVYNSCSTNLDGISWSDSELAKYDYIFLTDRDRDSSFLLY